MGIFFKRLKQLLRQKTNIFWSAIFPIVLGTFFYLSFAKIETDEMLNKIEINVVESAKLSDFKDFVEKLSNKVNVDFVVNDIQTIEQAQMKVDNYEIESYIYFDSGTIKHNILKDSIDNNIIRILINDYLQFESIVLENPSMSKEDIILILDSSLLSIDRTHLSLNPNMLYFYSLIALSCLFATQWGSGVVADVKADVSKTGARISISPTKKLKVLVIYFLAASFIQYLIGTLLLLYLRFVLGVSFGFHFVFMFILLIFGSGIGIGFGMLLGAFIKRSDYLRDWLAMAIALISSFLAGLMNASVKNMIDRILPFFRYINPASLINDAVVSISMYDSLGVFFLNISIMIGFILLIFGAVLYKMRGDKYAAI